MVSEISVNMKAKRRVTEPSSRPAQASSGARSSQANQSHPSVMVIEDESDLRELLQYNLSRDGFRVRCCDRAETSIKQMREDLPDVVLLDLMLPGMSGFDLCRLLKAHDRTSGLPLVMITAKGKESDIAAGLELGAEDYITKPFSTREVAARLRAVLRRSGDRALENEPRVTRVSDLEVDPVRHEARVRGQARRLTHMEFRIVELLARRPGRVFTRDQIIRGIQGGSAAVTDRTVDVHITALRRKLGSAGDYIQTVRGVGYRIDETPVC